MLQGARGRATFRWGGGLAVLQCPRPRGNLIRACLWSLEFRILESVDPFLSVYLLVCLLVYLVIRICIVSVENHFCFEKTI